jgi:hypothetical protein
MVMHRSRLTRSVIATICATTGALALNMAPASAHFCHETVNPAANPEVGDNGHPDDPFDGNAVPGGTSTSPGTNGNGPINPDGFYLVNGRLFSDTTVIDFPGAGVEWPTTAIKYTEWGKDEIKITSQIGGPKSAITYHVQAPGDLYVEAPAGDPRAVFCGVPPPRFK